MEMNVTEGLTALATIGVPVVLAVLLACRVLNCQSTYEPIFGKRVHELFARRQGRRA